MKPHMHIGCNWVTLTVIQELWGSKTHLVTKYNRKEAIPGLEFVWKLQVLATRTCTPATWFYAMVAWPGYQTKHLKSYTGFCTTLELISKNVIKNYSIVFYTSVVDTTVYCILADL